MQANRVKIWYNRCKQKQWKKLAFIGDGADAGEQPATDRGFLFPSGKLDLENGWIRLAVLVPWDVAEEWYAAQFKNSGHPAHPVRMVLGTLPIQRWLKYSD